MTRTSQQAKSQLTLPGQSHTAEGPHDHTGMYVMHFGFRRDLANLASAVANTPLGDTGTWAALQDRWQLFADIVHHHHAATECRRAGARLVFVGVHVSGVTLRGRLMRLLFRLLLPAYGPKLTIGARVETTSPEVVILVPSNFYDNDLTFLPDILAGTFPTPLRGVNRVAARDIGEVAAIALTDPDFPAGTHGISGPETLSGADSAVAWAEALGRPVRYTGADTDAWEAALGRRIPPGKKRDDWRNSFRTLSWMRVGTSPREVEETTRLLGRTPTTYRSWVRSQVDSRVEDQESPRERAGGPPMPTRRTVDAWGDDSPRSR